MILSKLKNFYGDLLYSDLVSGDWQHRGIFTTMGAFLLFTSLLISTVSVGATTKSSSNHIVGNTDVGTVLKSFETFKSNYEKFESRFVTYKAANQSEFAFLSQVKDLEVITMFGTWCHDSEREVPKLIKILKSLPNVKHTLVGIKLGKKEPQEYVEQHGLKYTPTIVILKNGVEIGRIVEKPEASLVKDLVAALKK